jgi:hypothetical protein
MNVSRFIPDWLVRPLLAVAGLTLVGVSGWYGPMITASIWHLFHPLGTIHYRGLNVRVPWPWIADTDTAKEDQAVTPEGVSLRKMPPTSIHHEAPQSMFITVISPDSGATAEEQTALWLNVFRDAHPGADFSARTAAGAPAKTSCLKAAYPTKPDEVVWTCISMSGGWVADLEGHPSEEAVFLRVIGGLGTRD